MFQKALPIWIPNQTHKEKLNTQLLFTAEVASLEGTVLHLTAADFYRVTVNGRFVGFGPARTAKGYARVDSYDLSAYDNQKLYADDTSVRGMIQRRRPNEIRVEVAGYHCSTLATALQDSFLAAELVDESGTPVLYTGGEYEGEGFYCFHHSRRARNVERYSVQRHFTEIWNEHVEDPKADFLRTEVEPIEGTITFLPRAVPMPRCDVLDITEFVSRGTCEAKEPTRLNSYSFPPAKEPDWGYFPEEKVEFKPFRYVNGQKLNQTEGAGQMPLTLQAGQWAVVDFKQLEVGFLRFAAEAEENAEVLLAFTEFIEQEPFSFTRMNAQNVIEYHIPKYKQLQAESFEPYSFRQVMILVKRGSIRLESVGYRTFERPMDAARELPISDPQLAGIYRAAKRTFAHNAVDIFMDCPSRERAGWLCDSFFTARAEHFFFGETLVEDAYLQNYLLYKNEGEFPEGVLPMCYPGDPHENNKFIPQWDLWYVLEVCEYLTKRRPDADRETFRVSVESILHFFARYENADGLLEKLPSWNFVEWSAANTWVQDVNYPTNFLYAGALEAAAQVFDRPQLREKAEAIRLEAVRQSFNGEVFCDHAIRKEDGSLELQPHVSEAAQYYALLFGGISLEESRFEALKAHVFDNFAAFAAGCEVSESDGHKEQSEGGERLTFCPVNAFIGFYLRLMLLQERGEKELLERDMKAFFGHMCEQTGTLWEYKTTRGSLDHGFASYAAVVLADLLEA